jgi:hypothetical protein
MERNAMQNFDEYIGHRVDLGYRYIEKIKLKL